MLADLFDFKFLTSLDFINGYYHIKCSQKPRYKIAFATIFEKYKFLRIPFGLAQVPAYFTALMQKVFSQFNDFCFFHMNDVLVHSSS